MDITRILNLISPKKEADKTFFLSLLDADSQLEYENERIQAVMSMLKITYIARLQKSIAEYNGEKKELLSSPDYNASSYRRILELNAQIEILNKKISSYKCFFDEPYFARMDLEDKKEGYNSY